MAIDLFGFTLFNPTCRLTNLSQYPLHDHIHRLFRRKPVRHERFHLFLVHAPDRRLVRYLGEGVVHLNNGDSLCRGIVFERDPRLDEPPRVLAREDDLLLYQDLIRSMTENVRRKLRHRVLSSFDGVIDIEFADLAVHEREIRIISSVLADVDDKLRNDLDAAIWSVIVYFRIPHLSAFADLNDSVHDVTHLLRFRRS